jgi:predicted Zn-dependent protease
MSETAAFSYSHATLQQFSEDVLKHARAKGATACEVDVSEGFGQSVTVRCDEVETIEFNRDKGIGITVYSGQRKGTPVPPTFRRRRCVKRLRQRSTSPASRLRMIVPVWPMRH